MELVERPVGTPAEGELLVRADWLSVDPYMRGRISRQQNYAAGARIGQMMTGGGVGEVLAYRYEEGGRQLALWAHEGRIRHREDVLDDIERLPEAFLRMLTGRNFGKQLVRLRATG